MLGYPRQNEEDSRVTNPQQASSFQKRWSKSKWNSNAFYKFKIFEDMVQSGPRLPPVEIKESNSSRQLMDFKEFLATSSAVSHDDVNKNCDGHDGVVEVWNPQVSNAVFILNGS